ncbi:MAG: hypothetical protein JWL91_892 [Sphingomonas bacterium]|nr:hypothetical protein [Sphingomonas bacterium]
MVYACDWVNGAGYAAVRRRGARIASMLAALAATIGAAGAPAALAAAPPAPAGPCTAATEACVDWIPLGSGAGVSRVYASHKLAKRNVKVTRALIMVHGTLRNGDLYFSTALAAAFIGKALDDTVVISPNFSSAAGRCADKLAPNEISWSCGGDSWRSGGVAASDPKLTSFDLVDKLVRMLADKAVFPNLKSVVIAGHSAGGQFVNRYSMANRIHDSAGVAMSYVVANPSSYAWPDATRPLPIDDGAPANAIGGWKEETKVHDAFRFGPFDPAKAPGYDTWPYGLTERTTGYTAGISDDQLKAQLASRPITYLLGQVDTLPLGGFDESPSAMAQGATRRARGEAFVKYVNDRLGGRAKAMIVPECGHNARCIFTTDDVMPLVFPL